jgi:hypothetical protein
MPRKRAVSPERAMRAIALDCTLKRGGGEPSMDRMTALVGQYLAAGGVALTDAIRIAGHRVHRGVESDEGDRDEWPAIRGRVPAADVLVQAICYWVGEAMQHRDFKDLDETPRSSTAPRA